MTQVMLHVLHQRSCWNSDCCLIAVSRFKWKNTRMLENTDRIYYAILLHFISKSRATWKKTGMDMCSLAQG